MAAAMALNLYKKRHKPLSQRSCTGCSAELSSPAMSLAPTVSSHFMQNCKVANSYVLCSSRLLKDD